MRRYGVSVSQSRAIRLSDVASIAGVSLSTASKALNGGGRISEVTRQRVIDAAARLDFQPNALARSFALGRSRTIGILAHYASSTFVGPVLTGAVLELGRRQQAVLVFDGDNSTHRLLAESIRTLQARRVDGLLVIGHGLDHVSSSISHQFDVPVNYAFTVSDFADDRMFLPDNVEIGRIAARHLIDRGRSRIVHITAGRDDIAVERRLRGMREVLADASLEPVAPVSYGGWTFEHGVRSMTALLDDGVDAEGLFAGNDHIASGALSVCEARGIRVPDDLAIVGVDNLEGFLGQGRTTLTTVDPELRTVGAQAAENLFQADLAPGEHLVAPRLVLGDST